MERTSRLILLAAALPHVGFARESAPSPTVPVVQVHAPSDLLRGEPVPATIVVRNHGGSGLSVPHGYPPWPLIVASSTGVPLACRWPNDPPAVSPAPRLLSPGQGAAVSAENLATLCPALDAAGVFLLTAEVPTTTATQGEGVTWNDRLASRPARITIREPTGADAAALAEFSAAMNDEGRRHRFLEKHAESAYAGWVLMRIGSGAMVLPMSGPELLAEVRKPGAESGVASTSTVRYPNGEVQMLTAEESAEAFIPLARRFLAAQPDHPTAGIVRLQLGMAYARLQRWQQSYDALSDAAAPSWWSGGDADMSEKIGRSVAAFRQELRKAGLASR